jgi:WD40 repeat protein
MRAARFVIAVILVFSSRLGFARADEPPATKTAEPIKHDAFGDPLPPGAYVRFGTTRLRHDAKAVAFRDDKTIVSVGSSIRIWDAATGRLIQEHRHEKLNSLSRAIISQDGKRAIVHHADNRYRVWDIDSGTLIREFIIGANQQKLHSWQSERLFASADGSRFVSLVGYIDTKVILAALVTIYSLNSRPESIDVDMSGTNIRGCAVSPDGNQVLVVADGRSSDDEKKRLIFLDAATGKPLPKAQRKISDADQTPFSPDGKTIALIGDSGIAVQTIDGKEIWRQGTEYASIDSACVCTERIVLTASTDDREREILVLDAASGKQLAHWPMPQGTSPTAAVSPDGKRIALTSLDRLYVLNAADGKEVVAASGHSNSITDVCVTPDGRSFASSAAGFDEALLWDVASGRVVRRFEASGTGITFSPDGKWLACSSLGNASVWEVSTGNQVFNLDRIGRTPVALCFLADGERLAIQTAHFPNDEIFVFHLASGKEVTKFSPPGANRFTGMFRSSNGRLLAIYAVRDPNLERAGRGRTSRMGMDVWDVLAGRLVRHLDETPSTDARSVLSPDRRTLAVRCEDGSICLFEIGTGQPRMTIKVPDKQRLRNSLVPELMEFGRAITFSPDGLVLAVASDGKPGVEFWELPTAKRVASFHGHDLSITTLEFTPDGRRLLSGSDDSTILGWDLARLEWRSRPPNSNLSDKDMAEHWQRLRNGTAEEAYRSKWAMAADPKKTVEFLGTRLPSWRAVSVERIKSWVVDLDSDRYADRDRAQSELQSHFDQSEEALRKTLAGYVSAEVRSRINRILDASFAAVPQPDLLRDLRATEVLEQIGTPEARALLHHLAEGTVSTRTSCDAAESLKRLEARPR